jgi:S-adenosylmethionine/arginine decarboxylase-like enzyme
MLHHIHLLGKAYINNPPRDEAIANEWLKSLVEKIDMKILMGPYSIHCNTLGNEGVTGAVVIETSHAAFHCWSEVDRPFLKFDVYSCVDFDPEVVLHHLNEYFDVDSASYMMIDRNPDVPVVVGQGMYSNGSIHRAAAPSRLRKFIRGLLARFA